MIKISYKYLILQYMTKKKRFMKIKFKDLFEAIYLKIINGASLRKNQVFYS